MKEQDKKILNIINNYLRITLQEISLKMKRNNETQIKLEYLAWKYNAKDISQLIVDAKAGIMYTWRSIQYNICSLSDERIDKIERYLKRVKNA